MAHTPAFKDMINLLCKDSPPSSPMSVQSPTAASFQDLVNTLCNVPLTSPPSSPSPIIQSLSPPDMQDDLCDMSMSPSSPLSPFNLMAQSQDSTRASFNNIVMNLGEVHLSPSFTVDPARSSPTCSPQINSFEALVRHYSQVYPATHGKSDDESSSVSSQDSVFELELDQESVRIPTPESDDGQALDAISEEHIAS